MNIEQGEILFEFFKAEEDAFNDGGYDILDVLFRTNKKVNLIQLKKLHLEVSYLDFC